MRDKAEGKSRFPAGIETERGAADDAEPGRSSGPRTQTAPEGLTPGARSRRPLVIWGAGAMGGSIGGVWAREGWDVLFVDNWGLVGEDSNDSDRTTQQLKALNALRDVRPDLAIVLIHHSKKTSANGAQGRRLSDDIRNSNAISSWYDIGLLYQRRSEQDPHRIVHPIAQ